jgi:hypothetical protein
MFFVDDGDKRRLWQWWDVGVFRLTMHSIPQHVTHVEASYQCCSVLGAHLELTASAYCDTLHDAESNKEEERETGRFCRACMINL